MNVSSGNSSFTGTQQQESFTTALIKNLIVTALCISINYINCILVYTFSQHQVFTSNPRYVLFIHLVVNDMIQLFVACALFVLSYTLRTFPVSFCLLFLIVAIATTFTTPLNLAGMAVECYIAVCMPLHHGRLCTLRRTCIFISLVWAVSGISILFDLMFLVTSESLEFFHTKIFCTRDLVFRSQFNLSKRDISQILCLVVVWLTLFYAYFRVLFTAKGAAAAVSKKTRNTILLHGFQLLLCMLNYVRPMLEQVLLSLWPGQNLVTIFISYIIIQIMPRFVSPIVYGLRDQTFRKYMRGYLLCRFRSKIHL